MFDSHCHLTDVEAPGDALRDAHRAGVQSLLTCGYNAASNEAVVALHRQVPALPWALGLHPWFANEPVEPVLRLIRTRRPTAIGEAGLDLWGAPPCHPIDLQREVLESQLQLAADLDLPVTLHSRKAIAPLLDVLRNHPRVRGALHAYGGSFEQLRPLLDRDFYIGVGGAVTRSRAKRVRKCAASLPLERILLETDAPAIGMDIVEPPGVRPAHLPRVLQALAELRGVPREELEAITDLNARRLFRLPPDATPVEPCCNPASNEPSD